VTSTWRNTSCFPAPCELPAESDRSGQFEPLVHLVSLITYHGGSKGFKILPCRRGSSIEEGTQLHPRSIYRIVLAIGQQTIHYCENGTELKLTLRATGAQDRSPDQVPRFFSTRHRPHPPLWSIPRQASCSSPATVARSTTHHRAVQV
jgi:hypothetical protein